MEDADVIVVGAGHNGLICAAYLARAGLSVLLVEARSSVGGVASTVDALGVRVNACNCDHSLVRGTSIIDELDLASHGLRYLEVEPAALFMSWCGGMPWLLFNDVERTLASLSAVYPREVSAYERYLEATLPIARLIFEIGNEPPSVARTGRALLARRGRGAATVQRWSRMSAFEVLSSFFHEDAICAAAIAAGPAASGAGPHTPGTGLAALTFALKHLLPTGRPAGGSGALPDAVASAFESAGGRVRCQSTVDRVLVSDDRVTGVVLTDGVSLHAPIVVSAIDPGVTFLTWLRQASVVPARLKRRWHQRPRRDGYESKLDAVVSAPPRFSALANLDLERLGVDDPLVPTTIIAPSTTDLATAHERLANGDVAERPIFYVNVPSVLDPSMRPAPSRDEHVLSVECLYTPYRLTGGWNGSPEPMRWLDALAALAQPGFREGVRRWRVVTPPDYEREFHLPRGVPPAFAGTPLRVLLGLDRELTRYHTPIRGLFLTGSGTFPGGGIWGASGRNTAMAVLRRRSASHHISGAICWPYV